MQNNIEFLISVLKWIVVCHLIIMGFTAWFSKYERMLWYSIYAEMLTFRGKRVWVDRVEDSFKHRIIAKQLEIHGGRDCRCDPIEISRGAWWHSYLKEKK